MFFSIVAVLLIILVWYTYPDTNNRLAATASAIRDIWTGTCGVTCRHHVKPCCSRSDLPTTSHIRTGSSSACVCQSCTCDLIDKFLGTCTPATDAYSHFVNLVATHYSNLLRAITEACANLARTLESSPSGRQAQLSDSQGAVRFPPTTSTPGEQKRVKHDKPVLSAPPTSTPREKKEGKDDKTGANDKKSHDTLKLDRNASATSSGCSRCIEEGKLCISGCPKGPNNKDQKNNQK